VNQSLLIFISLCRLFVACKKFNAYGSLLSAFNGLPNDQTTELCAICTDPIKGQHNFPQLILNLFSDPESSLTIHLRSARLPLTLSNFCPAIVLA
jgi:hypothetical protein